MSQIIIQKIEHEKEKREMINLLRTTKVKQTRNSFEREDGSMCALGLIGDKWWLHSFMDRSMIMNWNDKDHLSFREIADKLEEYWFS